MGPDQRKKMLLDGKMPVDFNLITRDTSDFIFRQAETLLKETHAIWDSFDVKINNLKILSIAIITALAAIIIGFEGKSSFSINLWVSLLFFGLWLSIIVTYLVWLTLPKKFNMAGNKPSDLLSPIVINKENKEMQDIELKASVMMQLENRISVNISTNKAVSNHYFAASVMFLLNPIISFLIYFSS